MLSRGVKELCIVRAAELMATRAVDDAHGAPENGVDGVDGVDAAMRRSLQLLRRLTASGFRLFY